MATETLNPDMEYSCSGLVTCDVLEHDEDPDVSSVTVSASANNTNTEYSEMADEKLEKESLFRDTVNTVIDPSSIREV